MASFKRTSLALFWFAIAFGAAPFMVLVAIVLTDSLYLWYGIPRDTAESRVIEPPFVLSQLRTEEI